ncbi:MAG: hypothetical protein Ta2E_03380 [Mycoplasmoidaceae bacterium]|nr:MAG: hypothetical protein Ta2E_03380 [Mycoplasmoidaceae bacterium]
MYESKLLIKKNILLASLFVFSASIVPSSVVLSAIFFSPAKKFFFLAGGEDHGKFGNLPGVPDNWQDHKVAMRPYGETILSRYRRTTDDGTNEFWALTNQDVNGDIPANSNDMAMDILGVHNGGTWRYWAMKDSSKNMYAEEYVFHGTGSGWNAIWNPNMNSYTHKRGNNGGQSDYSNPWCDGPYYIQQSNDANNWYWENIPVYTAWRLYWNMGGSADSWGEAKYGNSDQRWYDDSYSFKLIPNQIIYNPLRKIGGTSYSHWVGNNFNSSVNSSWPKGTYVDQSEALAIPKTVTALPNNFFSSANTSAPNVKKVFEDNRTETLTRTTDLPVGNNAFSSRTKLESIDLPHATTIGDSAFQNSSNINSISLPKATTIGQSAFAGLTKLESLLLSTVTTLGQNAFNGDANLKYINLAGLETTPNANVFAGCSSLTSLKLGVRPSNLKPLDYTGNFLSNTKIFTGNDINRSIFIPFRNACKANEYSTSAQPWNDSYYNPSFGWTSARTTGADKRLLSDLFVTYE